MCWLPEGMDSELPENRPTYYLARVGGDDVGGGEGEMDGLNVGASVSPPRLLLASRRALDIVLYSL